jgi:hypothetical protein
MNASELELDGGSSTMSARSLAKFYAHPSASLGVGRAASTKNFDL